MDEKQLIGCLKCQCMKGGQLAVKCGRNVLIDNRFSLSIPLLAIIIMRISSERTLWKLP